MAVSPTPTQDVFEKRIAALEGGVAALLLLPVQLPSPTPSRHWLRPATTSWLRRLSTGGSYNLLEHTLTQFGVTTTFVDAHDLEEVENAIQPNTKAVYLETLGNPQQ